MNNLKRLISALLCMAVMFTSVAVFADEAATDEVVATDAIDIDWDRIGLLEALGIIDPIDEASAQEFLSSQMTRAEFAVAIVRFANMEGIVGGTNEFKDVVADYFEEPYINTAVKAGLIAPVSEEYFYPKYPISYQDAAQAFVMSLGYTQMAQLNNSWLILAKKLGVLDGINTGETFTRAQAYRMMFNALHIDIMDINSMEGNVANFEVMDGVDVLYKNFNIAYEEGIITTADGVELGTGVLSGAKEYIVHNNTRYKYPNNNIDKHLGRNAVVYRDNDGNAVYVMLNRNNEITIPASEINSYNNFVYNYGENEVKVSTVVRPKVVLNNTTYTGEYLLSVMKPDAGSVTLVDNNNDNVYDVVFIRSYKDYYISSVITGSDKLLAEYGAGGATEIDLNPSVYDVDIYAADGTETNISGISVGSVVSLMESGTRKILYISDTKVTGSVSKASTTYAGGAVWTIDGVDYTLSDMLEAELALPTTQLTPIKIGESYEFSLDIYGDIVYYKKAAGDENASFYAILVAGKMEGLSNDVTLKVFAKTFGGFQSLTVPKKIRMNGTTLTSKAVYEALNRDGVDGYRATTGYIYPQPLKIKVNENNEVTYIAQASVKEYYDSMDGLDYASASGGLASYHYTFPTITEPNSFPGYEPEFYLYMGDMTTDGSTFAWRGVMNQPVRKGVKATSDKHPYSAQAASLDSLTTYRRMMSFKGSLTTAYRAPYYMKADSDGDTVVDVTATGVVKVGNMATDKESFFAMASVPSGQSFRMMAYKEDPDSTTCTLAILGVSADLADTVGTDFNIRVVLSVAEELVNDVKVVRVNTHAGHFYIDPAKINLDALPFYGYLEDRLNNPMTNEPTYKVNPGDIINVKTDVTNFATAVEPVFDATNGYFVGDYVRTPSTWGDSGPLQGGNKYYNSWNNPFCYGTRNQDNLNKLEWLRIKSYNSDTGVLEGSGWRYTTTAVEADPSVPLVSASQFIIDLSAGARETFSLSSVPGSTVVVERDRLGNITTRSAVESDYIGTDDSPGEAGIFLLGARYMQPVSGFIYPASYYKDLNWPMTPADIEAIRVPNTAYTP